MTTLRTQMIRLAYTQPDLREHLLPILAKTASYFAGVDSFVRLAILEGNAGVAAGSWTRNLKEGLRKAEAIFGNTLESQWYNPKGTVFIDSFRSHLTRMGFTEHELEEAVSNLPLSPYFHQLGEKFRVESVSFKQLMFEASKWAYRRSLSWKRKEDAYSNIPLNPNPTSLDRTWERLAEMPEVWAWLHSFWSKLYAKAPSKMNVISIKLKNPSLSYADISESLGLSPRTEPPAYVSKVMRDALTAAKLAVEDGKAPERIMDLLGM